MSQASYELKAEAREQVGKGSARAVRRDGKVPAVIYGDKQPPLAIALSYKEIFYKIHGGAFLTMSAFNSFFFEMINGRGWICIALVVFGRWDPWRSAGAALLFAFVDALQLRLQAAGLGHIPYEAFLMLPFVLTIVAMAFMSRNAVAPTALLKPFRREER